MRTDDVAIQYDCFFCSRPFRFGPHISNGKRIAAWDVMVCTRCYQGNWDGIVPTTRPHLVPYLESRGVAVKLNANGWIDFPS